MSQLESDLHSPSSLDPTPSPIDDPQIEESLQEYAEDSMDGPALTAFKQRLSTDPEFYASMGQSLAEMAMLIAAAAAVVDEAEFAKIRRRIFFVARQDNEHVKRLRTYYLTQYHRVDLSFCLNQEEAKERFESRLKSFYEDYQRQHP